MSGKAPQTAGRITVECPHCGFKQLESPYAKSTFCRKCSEHYELGKRQPESRETRPSLFARFGGLFARNKNRDITCFRCGREQTISTSAKSSLCPHCSTYVDLTDFKIKTTFSRSLETQGMVHITAKGDVSSARIACGDALIQGKLRGNLVCTGNARIKLKGKLLGSLDVKQLTIERRSEIEAIRSIKAKSVQVSGKISARLHVDGTVTVTKRGWLEGTVYAKGINIEKGGVFLGELVIGSQELSQPELIPLDPPPAEPSAPAPSPAPPASAGPSAGPSSDLDEGTLKFGVG